MNKLYEISSSVTTASVAAWNYTTTKAAVAVSFTVEKTKLVFASTSSFFSNTVVPRASSAANYTSAFFDKSTAFAASSINSKIVLGTVKGYTVAIPGMVCNLAAIALSAFVGYKLLSSKTVSEEVEGAAEGQKLKNAANCMKKATGIALAALAGFSTATTVTAFTGMKLLSISVGAAVTLVVTYDLYKNCIPKKSTSECEV